MLGLGGAALRNSDLGGTFLGPADDFMLRDKIGTRESAQLSTRLLACNCSSSSLFFSSYSAVVVTTGAVPPTLEADWAWSS